MFARRTIEMFERAGVERIAVNAAGCGSSMKEYGQLLADDPGVGRAREAFSARVRDVTEVIVRTRARHGRRAIHSRCGSRTTTPVTSRMPRACDSRRAICCTSIPGIEMLPFAEQDICCGSAGIYNLVEPEAAARTRRPESRRIIAVRPDIVATANPGCTLQMAAAARRLGRGWPIRHPVEILDASIAGRPVASLRDEPGILSVEILAALRALR